MVIWGEKILRDISPKRKLFLGTGISLMRQVVSIICGFILPRAILTQYGSDVNGLMSSIAQFLGFITMAELGVSSVVQANLYGPLARKDNKAISEVFVSSERFFRKVGFILLAYAVVLVFFYPLLVSENFDFIFTGSLILIIAISLFGQYFFGMTYRILLNADQYSFVVSIFQSAATILNTVISVILIRRGATIHFVKLTASMIFLLQPLCMGIYVKHHYSIDRKIKVEGEPIKQKWNGLAQHIAQVVATNTDTVVLTLFSTLSNVSIYSVYNLVISGIVSFFDALNLGFAPFMGNMLVKNKTKELDSFFDSFEWIWHTLTVYIFTVIGILIVPFVSVYTAGINDANYNVPTFGIIVTLAWASRILRTPYHIAVSAAGHYKQTQTSSYIEAALNIIISVAVVSRFGLIGVAVGTLVAMTYRTCYLPFYLQNNILNRDLSIFIKHILVDICSSILMVLFTLFLHGSTETYFEWFIMAIKVASICFAVTLIINIVFYFNFVTGLIGKLRKRQMQ